MDIRRITTDTDRAGWKAFVSANPHGTLWQSPEWETYQQALGRETRVYGAYEGPDLRAAALVVIDRTLGGFCTWDIPRGPLWTPGDELWAVRLVECIQGDARKSKGLSLYLSPPTALNAHSGQRTASPRREQPEATRMIDLRSDEEAILAQMKPKGRYNIRLALKHGVRVEPSADLHAWYRLVRSTTERDKFTGLPPASYQAFLGHLPGAFLLLAYAPPSSREDPRKPIAGLLGVIWKDQGIYYYGASDHAYRALMAPYLLQWEAMRHCRAAGCRSYDLLGIAPEGSPDTHPWAGISRFKAQFGGSVITYAPEQQIILRPLLLNLLTLKRRFF